MSKQTSGARYRVGTRAPFTMVPKDLIRDPRVDAYAIATYVILRSYADEDGENSYPSDATCADQIGCGRTTFIARRKLLRELGWIEWESGADAGAVNEYVIHEALPEGAPQAASTLPDPVHHANTPCSSGEHPPVHQANTRVQEASTPCSPGEHNQESVTKRKETPLTGVKEKKPTPPVSEPEADPLTPWLGQHAELLADCPLIRSDRDRRSLYQEYGPPGMRANVWKLPNGDPVPEDDRPRLFALGLAGYAREGHRAIVVNLFASLLRKLITDELGPPPPPRQSYRERSQDEEAREVEKRHESRRRMSAAQIQRAEQEAKAAENEEAEIWAWWEEQDEPTQRRMQAEAKERAGGRLTGSNPPAFLVRSQLIALIQEARGAAAFV